MIELKSKIRRWGNSFGIVVPLKKVSQEGIKEGDEVTILINLERKNVLRETFGALKGWKVNAQKIKDNLRKEEAQAEKRKWKM